MRLIRGFEGIVQSLFLRGEKWTGRRICTRVRRGSRSASARASLEGRDRVAATYRGHGHALTLGVDPQTL